MAISTEVVSKTFGPSVRDYAFKELEICARGCGAGWDGRVDLGYANEGNAKNTELKVLLVFAVPLTVNEEMTIMLYYGFDYSGLLHYGIVEWDASIAKFSFDRPNVRPASASNRESAPCSRENGLGSRGFLCGYATSRTSRPSISSSSNLTSSSSSISRSIRASSSLRRCSSSSI